jgi:hypothetical protein
LFANGAPAESLFPWGQSAVALEQGLAQGICGFLDQSGQDTTVQTSGMVRPQIRSQDAKALAAA